MINSSPFCLLQDLADLADLSLDAALTEDPAHIAGSTDPFATLASEPKEDAAMPYATYGQLVTPQAPSQAPATAHSPAGLAGGSGSATAGPALTEGPSPPTYQAASGMPVVTDPFAGFQGSGASSMQPDIQQPYEQQQQQASMQHLPPADASTPRGLSPEPVVNRDLPLFVTVTEPVKKEASGMLGMKGVQRRNASR